jgi:hypothetical protein
MMQVNELDGRPHADARGQRSRLAHQELRDRERVDLADVNRLAVMLADIGVVKAELVRQHDFGEVFVVGLCRGGVRAKAIGENSKFHFQSPIYRRHGTIPAAA